MFDPLFPVGERDLYNLMALDYAEYYVMRNVGLEFKDYTLLSPCYGYIQYLMFSASFC